MQIIKPCTSSDQKHDWEHVTDDLDICRTCGQTNEEKPNLGSNVLTGGGWNDASPRAAGDE